MQKRSWLLLSGAFCAAIFGVLLRWYQLARVYDPISAMPREGSLASIALGLLPLVYIAFLIFVLRRFYKGLPDKNHDALAAGKGILMPLVSTALGLAVCVSGILMLRGIFSFPFPNLRQLLALITILAGIGIALMGFLSKAPEKNLSCIAFILPVVFFCVYLIIFYKETQNDPIKWNYALQLLAIAVNTLSFFHLAGFVFRTPRPLRTVCFCLLAFSVSIVLLADGLPLCENILFAALGLTNLLFAAVILENTDKLTAQN